MICSRSYLESVAHPMIDRTAFSVWFPIDNKYLSFDSRGFAEVRRGSIYFHADAPSLTNCIVKFPVLALKHVVAG
jgi:hypothetical protein